MATTVKPSGLTISKSGNRLNLSWKTGQVYTKQQYRYTFKGAAPTKVGIKDRTGYVEINEGTTHTAYVDIPLTKLYPSDTKTKAQGLRLKSEATAKQQISGARGLKPHINSLSQMIRQSPGRM